MKTLLDDLRLAVRVLRKSPGTTMLAILVLALGIGANSAMFSLVDTLLFRPLAFEDPEEIAGAFVRDTEDGSYQAFSYPDYLDLSRGTEAFESLAAHSFAIVGLEEEGSTERTFVDVVSSNWFATFGVTPVLGRTFLPEEELPGRAARVVILGHDLWQRSGADPDVVGSTLTLNSQPFTVVGVAPPRFAGTMAVVAPELYAPLSAHSLLANDFIDGSGRPLDDRENRFLILVGRLAEGIDVETASSDVARVASLLEEAYPGQNQGLTFEVHELSRVSVSTSPQLDEGMGALSALLLGMAFVVLLVAALNLTTVQSARTLARQPEIAVRLAMGSGRWPIVRQLLVEGFLLALGGGILGLSAAWLVPLLIERSILRFAPLDVMVSAPLDARIIGATIVFCLLAAVLFGLAPALRASRPDLAQVLREGGPGAEGGRRSVWSRTNLPVLAEIALTLVLLVVGGLFVKAALGAARVDPGFPVEGLVVAETDTSYLGWDEARGAEASRRLQERLQVLPGVRSVEVAAIVPFGMVSLGTGVEPAEQPGDEEGGIEVGASTNWVGPSYFETLEIPLLRGRTFRESESGAVVVVNQALAERLWPGEEAVGRSVRFSQQDETVEAEVVGMVATTRDSLFESSERPMLFRPFSQNFYANHHYHLRLEEGASAEGILPSVREAMREIDAAMPILALRSFEDHLDQSMEVWMMRAGARIFGAFAAVALLLAVAGVYGVRAYSVERRTRELGIRMALGSSVRDTLWLVLREGLRLGLVGGLVGLVLAFAAGRLVSSFLVGVSASDPWVFLAALLILLTVVLLACLLPARRAARLDPLEALRYE